MKGNFANLINSDQLTLIDFSAEWCGPCKMLAPILKQVKDEMGNSLKIVKIDVDKNQSLANTYQVKGVPTMIFFKDGEAAKTLVGADATLCATIIQLLLKL